jgi:segregation and condensation protein B
MPLEASIEAFLFYRAEPVAKAELAKIFAVDETAIASALKTLEGSLADRGVRLLAYDNAVALVTAPEAASLVDRLRTEELSNDIGKAGLETLSIVLYRAPVTRTAIDYIRGVNSQSILRTLTIRGLIEKIASADGVRVSSYQPTLDLLAHLGITAIDQLPHYQQSREELSQAEANQ